MTARESYYKPKSISIAGVTFKIHYKPINDYGLCDIDKKLITIRDSLSNQETLETILHESLHACLAVSGLSYLINNEDTEEALYLGGNIDKHMKTNLFFTMLFWYSHKRQERRKRQTQHKK